MFGSRNRLIYGASALALTIAVLGVAISADADRKPTSNERQKIVTAVKTSAFTAGVPRDSYDVRAIRISTVKTSHRRYGRVRLVPRPGVTRDGADGIVRRRNGRWRLIDLGTSGVGCHTLPAAVRDDLGIGADGDPC